MEFEKTPVILDTDIGTDIDDTWALGLLLKSHELDTKLITTTYGDTELRARLTAKLLETARRTDIPVGIGLSKGKSIYPQESWITDYNLSQYPGVIHEDGVDAIIDTILASEKPVTIIGIGPTGNIGEALKREPKIAENSRYIGMQGSIRIGYNEKPEPNPEYNVILDIKGCQTTFSAPWEVTITPLDTCGSVTLSGSTYRRIQESNDPFLNVIKENYKIWSQNFPLGKQYDINKETSILFDTVAIYLAFSEELLNMEMLGIRVTEDGKTVINTSAKEINCATSWKNLSKFKELIVDRLTSS
ncbi:MAG: nucleoside hydrolase [Promethearchaeota archaeon]